MLECGYPQGSIHGHIWPVSNVFQIRRCVCEVAASIDTAVNPLRTTDAPVSQSFCRDLCLTANIFLRKAVVPPICHEKMPVHLLNTDEEKLLTNRETKFLQKKNKRRCNGFDSKTEAFYIETFTSQKSVKQTLVPSSPIVSVGVKIVRQLDLLFCDKLNLSF